MTFRVLLVGASLMGLTACGGGGGNVNLGGGGVTFGDLVTETNRLTTLVNETGGTYDEADPDLGAGTPTYDGVILLQEPGAGVGNRAWIGRVIVDVDFAANTLDGEADNFFQNFIGAGGVPQGPVNSRAGTMTFDANFGTDPDFDVTVGGTFSPLGAAPEAVTGTVDGNFFGPGGGSVDALAFFGDIDVGALDLEIGVVTD